MRYRPLVITALMCVGSSAMAQTPPAYPVASPNAASAPAANPSAAPASASMPVQTNPAAAPVIPHSGAGATERGLAPVQPAQASGVTQRVRNAAAHDVDADGHTLDPHGKPVGQSIGSPPPATTVTRP